MNRLRSITHTGDAIPTSVADVQPTSSATQLCKSVGKVNGITWFCSHII